MNSLESIRNYVRLTPEIGTAGQPRREQFDTIAEAGFETVINLAMPDHQDSIADEGRLVTALGMTYCHLPVPFDAPTPVQVQQFCALLDALRGHKLFIHCIMNYRVSAFMYLYLTRVRGVPEAKARSPILDRWSIEPQWQALMAMDSRALGLNPHIARAE
ncbi:MAG: protein tyrosine phosphatase family protein [Gammaproteobacteria bacterium]